MLFRTLDGRLIEINRSSFKNDLHYYRHILEYVYNHTNKENYSKTILKLVS